jgi:hypothetical protein
MFRLVRAAGVVLATLLLGAGYPGAIVIGLVAGLRQQPASAGWLHVQQSPEGAFIADAQGRRVILHGAVAAGLVDYWWGSDPAATDPPPRWPIDPTAYEDGRCPANDDSIWIPPLCRIDLAQMHALGFNVVRLALSWSLLEPERGRISQSYLDRIAQVVGWAREQGIYVILDLHQNAYSRYVGRASAPQLGGSPPGLNDYDGAPAWATITDGLPSVKYAGQRELNPAAVEAVNNFWWNRDGIQEEYIRALGALALRFRGDSSVAGFSPYNEPWIGWSAPPAADDLQVQPFYRRVIDALTGTADALPCPATVPVAVCGHSDLGVDDHRHLFFLEVGLSREIADFPVHLPLPVSAYPNVALALHAYTHIYTPDALAGIPAGRSTWPPYDQSYAWAEREARATGAALFVSEYGNDPRDDARLLAAQVAEQQRHRLGSVFWVWKQNCGLGDTWGIFSGIHGDSGDQRCAYDRGGSVTAGPANGCVRVARARLLAPAVDLARLPGACVGAANGG